MGRAIWLMHQPGSKGHIYVHICASTDMRYDADNLIVTSQPGSQRLVNTEYGILRALNSTHAPEMHPAINPNQLIGLSPDGA